VFVFPGLKCANAEFLRVPLAQYLGQTVSVAYAQRGLDPEEIGTNLTEELAKRELSSFRLVGHSLGLVTALLSLQKAVEAGRRVTPVTEIWALGSPYSDADIRNADKYQRLPAVVGSLGGVICKYGGAVITDTWNMPHPLHHLAGNVHNALAHHADIQNPRQWASQLQLAYEVRKMLNLSVLADAGVLGNHTRVHLGYDRDDKVIFGERAAEYGEDSFEKVGAKVMSQMNALGTHADAEAFGSEYWLGVDRATLQLAA
jgi:hypothetical protein